jgi:hypothetical protein
MSGSAARIIEAPLRLFSRNRDGKMAAVPEDVTGAAERRDVQARRPS